MIENFAALVRERQLAWALSGGIPTTALEERHGNISWVLKPEYRKMNLFRQDWWAHIEGSEHRWARALNSSQCFAVNLFAPLAEDSARARTALQHLLPVRDLAAQDSVTVRFEFTPVGTREWLGEKGQSTQVDVYFKIIRANRCIGHVLVEVKFSEESFGCCRGWKTEKKNVWPNLNRCLDVAKVIASPKANCWLSEIDGRKYWEIMSSPKSSLQVDAIRQAGGCPFRHGLYQMMRNRVLADELVRNTGADWADFAVCLHPSNKAIRALADPVLSQNAGIDAFRLLSSNESVLDWDAERVCKIIEATDDALSDWGNWIRKRYFK